MCLGKGSVKGSVPANMHRETNTQTFKKTKFATKVWVLEWWIFKKRVFPDYGMPNFVISCSIVALLEHITTLFLF